MFADGAGPEVGLFDVDTGLGAPPLTSDGGNPLRYQALLTSVGAHGRVMVTSQYPPVAYPSSGPVPPVSELVSVNAIVPMEG